MNYKVKKHPEKIFEAVTYEFTLEDEKGKEYLIRKWEDSNGGGFYIFLDGEWFDFNPNEELHDFIDYDLDF